MKISWLVLTYNRAEKVQRAMTHNVACMGVPKAGVELVWVDNGSRDGLREIMYPFVDWFNSAQLCWFEENQGVARGYNEAMRRATGELLVITGCDMLMPPNWLRTFMDCFDRIPETGVACMYSGPLSWVPERIRGEEELRNGLKIRPAMPIGRRMFRRGLLRDAGFLREDFGLYGWEDVEWGYRVERVCREQGLLTYVLPEHVAEHLGTEGVVGYDGKDEREYHAFKQREANDPKKQELMEWCHRNAYPYYNPFKTEA